MADISAMLTSTTGSYLTPPAVLGCLHRWWGHDFLDPYSNGASLVGAKYTTALERGEDGNAVDWSRYGRAYCNPEYGGALEPAMATMHRFGRVLRSCEIVALVPSRTDTQWRVKYVVASANAWIDVEGRLTFWLLIPIRKPADAHDGGVTNDKKVKATPYLQRWYPGASEDNLPAPFRRSKVPGYAVGPELGKDGKPSPAPFPSLIPYWGSDIEGFYRHFRRFGPLTIPRDYAPMPRMPSADELATCPESVRAWVEAAAKRRAGVYPRRGPVVDVEASEAAE